MQKRTISIKVKTMNKGYFKLSFGKLNNFKRIRYYCILSTVKLSEVQLQNIIVILDEYTHIEDY